jgi:hypothetical protein
MLGMPSPPYLSGIYGSRVCRVEKKNIRERRGREMGQL